MQLTANFNFYRRPENEEVYDWLVEACTVAKNLYNQTLYYAYEFKKAYDPVRDQYKKDTGKVFPWFPEEYVGYDAPVDDFFKVMCLRRYASEQDESGDYYTKNLEGKSNWELLKNLVGRDATSEVLRTMLAKNLKSYGKSLGDWSRHPEKYKGMPKKPGFYKSDELCPLYFSGATIKIDTKTCSIIFPKPRGTDGDRKAIYIPLQKLPHNSSYKSGKKIDQVRIIPKKGYFKVEIIYTYDEAIPLRDNGRYLSIDLGVKNFCTMITSDKNLNPVILDGNAVKTLNRYYHLIVDKLKHKIEVVTDKDGKKRPKQYTTKRIDAITKNNNNRITAIIEFYTKYIVRYCLHYNICRVICGWNKDMKQKINIGHKNNQMIVNFPFKKLLDKLEYKCKMRGISFEIVEESYTSKTDHLRNAPLATKEDPQTRDEANFGKRIHRGLFLSDTGKLVNADVNGAMGIMRKAIPDFSWVGYHPFYPVRMKVKDVVEGLKYSKFPK